MYEEKSCPGLQLVHNSHICSPLPATSYGPLHSLDQQVLFVPRVRTTMAQTSSFATIGPSSIHLTLLSGSCSASLSLLITYFFSRGLCTESATEWSLP